MEAPQRSCPNCGKPLGSGYQVKGAASEALLELAPGQADRFNSFQKLEVMTGFGDLEAPFDVADRNRLRIYFKRPAVLPDKVEVAPIEGGAVAAAQRHALDMALSGHPDLATACLKTRPCFGRRQASSLYYQRSFQLAIASLEKGIRFLSRDSRDSAMATATAADKMSARTPVA